MAMTDDMLIELLGNNAALFAAFKKWSDGQIMLLAGTTDDPASFNKDGGKDGALGYYPVVNVNDQTIYVPCVARLATIALGGANAETLDGLIAMTGEKLAAVDAATAAATGAAQAATTKTAETEAARAAAQQVVDAGAAIVGAKDDAVTARNQSLAARDETRQVATEVRQTLSSAGAWYDRHRQVATAEIDRNDRPTRVVYLDGTRRDYAVSTDPVIAGRLAAGGFTVEAASGRLYLMRQEVVTAEVSANDRVLRATMLGGAAFPPRGSGGGTPTPTPTPTPGVATRLEAGGFVVSAVAERLYLLRQEVVCATVDTVGKTLRADLLGGGAFPPRVLPPVVTTPALPDIVCAGDSLTAAGYGNVLATLTGRNVVTMAIGGQTSRHIAGRLSAVAYRLTVENNQVNAGANTITAINGVAFVGMSGAPSTNTQFLATASNNTLYTAKGWFGSVYGTATRVVSGGPPSTSEGMTFTPDPGQPLPIKIPAETPFVVDYAFDARTHIIWPGRNNYRDTAQVLSDVDAMVRRIGHSRIVLMPPPNGDIAGERASAANPVNYVCFRTLENAMSEKYPRFYLPIRRLLIDKALPALGITPTAQDLIDIADDTVPASCRTDTVHHTTAVRGFIAAEVAAHLSARGI